ncbi:MAG: cytochrome c3 family protein [Phycisphaerae bacterium]
MNSAQQYDSHHSTRGKLLLSAAALGLLRIVLVASGQETIVNSKHDLSRFGPGPVRATNEDRICIFCHTPHNASPAAPLWNRHNPRTHYRIYQSSTTDARVDQPGAASKLCLSCHDGSIAIGLTRGSETPIPMTHPLIPTGPSDLTNDLSDDHPIGFRFDRQLTNRDSQLRLPDLVDHRIPLGERGQLECTACHDPHNNEFGDFLRLPTRRGALCITCHDLTGWEASAHATTSKPMPATLAGVEPFPFPGIADNACNACHVSHNAPQAPRLLRAQTDELCFSCHDGTVGSDILSVANLRSGHNVKRRQGVHDPAEDPRSMPTHVSCADCHNPHATRGAPQALANSLLQQGPAYTATLEGTSGVSISGGLVEEARYYYEVCFRCHADNPVRNPARIVRDRDDFGNIRRQFLPTAASAHPVTFAARQGNDVPSLIQSQRNNLQMNCQDCHNNPDARQLGGVSPNGPHGSRYDFLLVDRYETQDFTVESSSAYALCYQCHDRNSILSDESFSLHRRHVVDGRTPCSACHTAHGVSGSPRSHSHLINFDASIVQGERQFVDTGRFRGSCTLTCHGVRHVNLTYGQ